MLSNKASHTARLTSVRPTVAQPCGLMSLPDDISAHTVSFLPVFDQLSFEECSHAAREVGRRAALQVAAYSFDDCTCISLCAHTELLAVSKRCTALVCVNLSGCATITDAAA